MFADRQTDRHAHHNNRLPYAAGEAISRGKVSIAVIRSLLIRMSAVIIEIKKNWSELRPA